MEHKMRMLLTALGVILGVSMFLAVSILNQSMLRTFEEINMNSGGRTDVIVTKNNAFSSSDLKYIKSLEGVEYIAPFSSDYVRLKNIKGEKEWVRVKGIDIGLDRAIRDYHISEGEWFSGSEEREIIINKKSAGQLGLSCNDIVYLPTNTGEKKYRVVAIIEDKGAGLPFWHPEMYAPIDSITFDSGHRNIYGRIDLDISDDSLIVPTAEKIKKHFGDVVNTQTLTERLSMAKRNMGGMVMGFYCVLAVVIFVGCFLIYNTFMVIVMERIQLIGLLRTLGMDKKQTIRMILVEGVLLGIVGTIVGIALGLGIAWGLLNLMSKSINIDYSGFIINPSNIVSASVIGLVMPILSCLIPGRRASKYVPIQALKITDSTYSASDKKKGIFKRYKTLFGMLLIVIFVINFEVLARYTDSELINNVVLPMSLPVAFLGVIFIIPFLLEKTVNIVNGLTKSMMSGRTILSTRNLLRNKSRTSITVSIVIIGITMSIGFSGMFNSVTETVVSLLDRSLKGDIVVHIDWNLEDDNNMRKLKSIRKAPGVECAYYLREEYFQDDDKRWIKIMGVKPDEHKATGYFDMIEGDSDEVYARMETGERVAVVGEYYSKELGLRVGDTINLKGRTKKYQFTIAGIINDMNPEVAYIDRDILDDMYGGKGANAIIVKVVEDTDIDALRDKISDDIIKDDSVSVETSYEMRETMKKEVMSGTEPFDVINVVTLIVALFGLMNTLLMSILERRREIGMLRSIGSSKSHIRRMIFGESITMGLFSIIIGTLTGFAFVREANTAMGGMFGVSINMYMPYNFVIVSCIAVFICAFAAAIYPSNLAVKTGIVEAIKGE
ncbi:MAG: ABC transporter permease [Clostridia bacterium]|nr:ABC transporter permease [Clostridia bacterium]